MELVDILKAGVGMGGSDIHLTVGSTPLVRVSDSFFEVPGFPALDEESCKEVVYSALYEGQRAKFEAELDLDASIHIQGLARFRVSALLQKGNVEAVFRVIPSEIPGPEQLGLGPAAAALADLPRGLVLVTGPTGNGKSTTLACLIERINRFQSRHIITIEDPIEFIYKRKRSLIRQREVGSDTRTFQSALRHALRQDPDVILVGELRDHETISLALTAAETGHLCFATLHTSDAAQTVDRIVDVFPSQQQEQIRVQLAGTLKGIISQILLPRKDGKGRIAARELLLVTPAVSNLIREGKSHMIANVIETSGKIGMYTMGKALDMLVRRGAVDAREAAAKVPDVRTMSTAGAEVLA